jgi:hypothetical protein
MASLLLLCLLFPSALGAILEGASLQINWCDSSDSLQQFVVAATSVTSADGSLCATMSSPYPAALTMERCSGLPTQQWTFNTSVPDAFTSGTGADCLLWNTQGGPGYERPTSTVGVYQCSLPTPFDSVFAPGVPAPGLLAATMTSPGNSTFSNLCVQAVNPSPPAIGTPQQIAWAESEMACFYHFNMATAAGSQGCGGCSRPPPISIWNPVSALISRLLFLHTHPSRSHPAFRPPSTRTTG